MYVDNELSAAERKAVELFTAQNPDLQQELLMLKETVLQPMPVFFNDKSSLLKMDDVLQEKLLLYLDNELNADERKAVEALIASDKAVAAEWSILQFSKLDVTEKIVFNDKHLLYKKEPAKVVGIRWWRIAAAAILIGFGAWGTISLLQNKKTTDIDVVKNHTKGKNGQSENGQTNENNTPIIVLPKQDEKNEISPDQQTADNNIVSPVIVPKQILVNNNADHKKDDVVLPVKKSNDVNEPVVRDKNEDVAVQSNDVNKPTNNLPTPLQNINKNDRNISNPVAVTLTERSSSDIPDKRDAVLNKKIDGVGIAKPLFAVNNINSDENGDADDEPSGKKSKFKGLLRKVKRVLERNTSASGSSVKIAGFDVAVK